jgi:hypothetical protein
MDRWFFERHPRTGLAMIPTTPGTAAGAAYEVFLAINFLHYRTLE